MEPSGKVTLKSHEGQTMFSAYAFLEKTRRKMPLIQNLRAASNNAGEAKNMATGQFKGVSEIALALGAFFILDSSISNFQVLKQVGYVSQLGHHFQNSKFEKDEIST